VKIRQAAATDLEVIFKKEVLLFLWIKMRKGTTSTEELS
jgi:GTPase Era involved in 16S rRNA processing